MVPGGNYRQQSRRRAVLKVLGPEHRETADAALLQCTLLLGRVRDARQPCEMAARVLAKSGSREGGRLSTALTQLARAYLMASDTTRADSVRARLRQLARDTTDGTTGDNAR